MKKPSTVELSIDGKVYFVKVPEDSNIHIIVANGELLEVRNQTETEIKGPKVSSK